ncbi:hypothetical protein GcM1_222005b [Golovinomyces cichoracearum]|uniref:Secreted effector protein n=1 Tax=Golovinomyces cichoracearum TaxID=62708 RepID=A0A420IR88_9PEZI|nr:hypothetical protein GcM1_222005b [Golovinomyces cichoracearum]
MRKCLIITVLSAILFTSISCLKTGRHPSVKKIPPYVLRPQRKPMKGYDCRVGFYLKLNADRAENIACTRLNKPWYSRMFYKYPKKYNTKSGHANSSGEKLYKYPLLLEKVYKGIRSNPDGNAFLIMNKKCEFIEVVSKKPCKPGICPKKVEYEKCKLESIVPQGYSQDT